MLTVRNADDEITNVNKFMVVKSNNAKIEKKNPNEIGYRVLI